MRLAAMLCVRDLDASLAFYGDGLGLPLVQRLEELAILRVAESALVYLFTESPPTPDKPDVHVAPPERDARPSTILVLQVGDCRALHAELVQRGVAFLTPPWQPPWGGWRCFTRDPDGFVVELEEPPR